MALEIFPHWRQPGFLVFPVPGICPRAEKRCNWQGALAGMLSGGLMVFVWKYIISPLGGVFGIYELLPAFLISLVVCVVVSLVTPAPSAEIEAEFDAAK